MKLDVKKIRPIYGPKDPQVLDPVRYPKVIKRYESQMKKSFAEASNMLISSFTQKMVEFKNDK